LACAEAAVFVAGDQNRRLKCGVVDENVELAEFIHGLLDRVPAEFGIVHIYGKQNATTPFFFHGALRFLCVLMFVEIGRCHVRSFAREQDGDSTADA
jgi:hypothetical protein